MERDYYFDNAKCILILLVVLGHIMEPWANVPNHPLRPLFLFIYAFHMPAFVFISGYFSKNLKHLTSKEIKYLLLFICATLIYWPLSNENLITVFVIPFYILWYLLNLAYWTALLPYVSKLKHPIIIAFFVALVAGYLDLIGPMFSLSRAITFLPFFLLGYFADKEQMHPLSKTISIIILGVSFIGITWLSPYIDTKWLWGAHPYSSIGHTEWYAGVYRLLTYTLAMIMGISFFSLIPRVKHWYTYLGSQTLIIYLAHGLIIKAITH